MLIKSSKRLCENYTEISDLANSTDEPIYITKDGEGDLVLLSMRAYEKFGQLEQRQKPNDRGEFDIEKKPEINIRSGNMTEYELGIKLKSMYENAPRGDQVAYIHLFGIIYADVLSSERLSKREILKNAGLPESYQTEISKGVRLAQYVVVKEQYSFDS